MKKIVAAFGKITLSIFLLSSVQLMAQEKDDNGDTYVITKTGDTLKGQIIDRDKKTNLRFEDQKIKLIISETEKKSYSPGKIKGYSKDNAFYESVTIKEGEYAFMEVIERGALVLYKLDLERIKSGEVEVFETQYYVKRSKDKTGLVVRIKDNNFKKEMMKLCADNQDIADEIESKDYVFEDIEKLVRDYNKAAEGGSKAKGTKAAPKKETEDKGTKSKKSKDEEEEEEEEE